MALNDTVDEECSILSCSADGIIRMCYSHVSWSDETYFCDCNVFPGWVGPDCDVVSSELIHSRVWNVSTAIALICLALLMVFDISRLLYIRYHDGGHDQVHPPLSLYVAAFATLSCYLCHFVYSCILAKSTFDPSATEAFENFSSVNIKNVQAAYVFWNLVLGSAMIAELQITLAWINVTENIRGFTAFNLGKWKTAVNGYKIFAHVATLFSLPLAIFFAAKSDAYAMQITKIVVVTSLAGFLLIGRIRFVSALRSVRINSRSTDDFKRPLNLVKKTSCYVLVVTFLATVALAIRLIVVKTGALEVPVGNFRFDELFGNISFLSAYCFFMIFHWYIHQLTNTFATRKWKRNFKTKGIVTVKSMPFRKPADKENQADKLLPEKLSL